MSFNEEREQNVRMTRRRQQKEKMRKRLIMVGASAAVVLLIAGGAGAYYLYGREDSTAQASQETSTQQTDHTEQTTEATSEPEISEEKEPTKESVNHDLQSILTSYSDKITQKTPVLIEEYHAEIKDNQNGLAGLSTIANQKANALQAVADEGIQKMQKAYHDAGSLETVDLGSWTNQLSEKYTEQVAQISAALIQSRAEFQANAETQQTTTETQQTSVESSETTETTSTTSTEASAMAESAETTGTTESNHTYDQNTSQASGSTTVVYSGEGPNQIAERTGVPVERLLELNGMTMDNFFMNPGDVLRLN